MVVAWGLNYPFVRVGLLASPPLWLAGFRAGVGAVGVVVGLLLRPATRTLTRRERWDALWIGVPNSALFFGLWFVAATQVPPGETAVVIYTFPLWVALLSAPILASRLTPLAWGSVVVGFLGVVLLQQPWAAGVGRIPPVALAELLGAAVCWAFGTVFYKLRFRGEAMRVANAYQLTSGAVALLVGALILEPSPSFVLGISLIGSLVWLGLVGTAFAYAVWFALLQRFPAVMVSSWAFLVPVIALGSSAVAFGERLDAIQLVGVACVLGSVYGSARILPAAAH